MFKAGIQNGQKARRGLPSPASGKQSAGLPVLEKMDSKLPLANLGWGTSHFLDSWVPGSHLRSLDTASDLALAAHGDTAAGLGAAGFDAIHWI